MDMIDNGRRGRASGLETALATVGLYDDHQALEVSANGYLGLLATELCEMTALSCVQRNVRPDYNSMILRCRPARIPRRWLRRVRMARCNRGTSGDPET